MCNLRKPCWCATYWEIVVLRSHKKKGRKETKSGENSSFKEEEESFVLPEHGCMLQNDSFPDIRMRLSSVPKISPRWAARMRSYMLSLVSNVCLSYEQLRKKRSVLINATQIGWPEFLFQTSVLTLVSRSLTWI